MSLFSIKPQSINPAQDLLGQMDSPARKFNFDCEFILEDAVADSETQKFHFFVRSIDKPTYNFKFVEINQYGFRYKVMTGVEFGDLGIEFMDDSRSRVLNFINNYLIRTSAGNNARFQQTGTIPLMAQQGLERASITPRSAQGQTIIKQIKIHQYAGIGPDGTGRGKIRTWIFEEPQVIDFDMDKVDSAEDSLSGFVVKFNFKNVVLELYNGQYPDRSDNPLEGLSDIFGSIGTSDSIVARNALQSALRVSEDGIFSTGLLGSTPFDFLPQGQIIRSGLGLGRTASQAADVLGVQDLLATTNRNRNDLVNSLPSINNVGTVAQGIPSAASQAAKLAKFF